VHELIDASDEIAIESSIVASSPTHSPSLSFLPSLGRWVSDAVEPYR
jgi:hypothetical protein